MPWQSIPCQVANAGKATAKELKLELAVHLHETKRLAIGHRRERAGMSLCEFRQLVTSRKISPHYDVADLNDDIKPEPSWMINGGCF